MNMNEDKLHAFLGKAVDDLGAAISSTLMIVGDRLAFTRPWRKVR